MMEKFDYTGRCPQFETVLEPHQLSHIAIEEPPNKLLENVVVNLMFNYYC